ncbi:MAG TPA: histidine kinase dimerization/phospho-acceptor domain-containing protein, partial [Crinalium sp.]
MKNFPFPLRFSIPIVLVLFSSVLGLASFHREITETYETTELTASRYAQSLGSQIAGTLNYLYRRDDAEQAEIVISQLGSDSRLDLVLVLDESDRILLSNHYEFRKRAVSDVLGTYDAAGLMPKLMSVQERIAGEISLSQDRQHIYVIYPVFLQAKPGELRPSRVGILFMKYDLRREKQAAYEKAWQRNLINSSALLLFCVGLWLFFDVTLTRRINRLVVVSNSLANGDFSVRTGLSGSDEVAQLSIAFDRMADGIQGNTKALHRQNAILKAQQEAAIDGILIVDEHWHVISYNQRFCQLWQLPTDIHIDEHQQLLEPILAQLMQPDEFLAKIEFLNRQPEAASRGEILLKNGCIVDCYSASVTSLTGEHYGRIWYFRDISNLKQSEEEIKRVQWFLDAIIENIPNMIFVKDAEELRFVRINKAGEDLLGYVREELLGKNDYDFFTKDEADFFTSKDRNILATGNILDISEEPIHTKHQGTRILHTKKLPITDETSNRQYILGISEDITERKQADIELRQAKESAEAANRAKSEFLANMSHELRTPLNAILGFAQLLSNSSDLDADQQENIRIISRSGQHLLNLINQILDISKIEAGRIVLNEQDFDFYSVLDELEEMFYLQARKKGLKFTVICSPEVPRHIQSDPLKLRQVLINLLSNAIKFTETGTVSLQVHIKDKFAIASSLSLLTPCTLSFELKDTGVGIPPDQINHVFEAFTQIQTGKEAGTGLGL